MANRLFGLTGGDLYILGVYVLVALCCAVDRVHPFSFAALSGDKPTGGRHVNAVSSSPRVRPAGDC